MIFTQVAQAMGRIVGNFPPRPRPETAHFSAAVAGPVTLAPPGVPTPAAFAVFGVINIRDPETIAFANVHGMFDNGGAVNGVFELWKLDSPGALPVLIAVCSITGGLGNYQAAVFGFLTDDLRRVEAGNYLLCQATTASTGSPYSGYTIDVHFE
jgi:hypothetical protein